MVVVTHTHAKDQGQSVQKIEWKQTDGWKEAIALPPVLTRSIIKTNISIHTYRYWRQRGFPLLQADFDTLSAQQVKRRNNNK